MEKNKRLYKIWDGMKQRCLNPNATQYKNYGGRGITVCDDWLHPTKFSDWALSNGYADGLTIDRLDFNGNYEPDNCWWATPQEQNQNKRHQGSMLECQLSPENKELVRKILHQVWRDNKIKEIKLKAAGFIEKRYFVHSSNREEVEKLIGKAIKEHNLFAPTV